MFNFLWSIYKEVVRLFDFIWSIYKKLCGLFNFRGSIYKEHKGVCLIFFGPSIKTWQPV